MTIDWSATGSMISGVGSWVQAGAGFFGGAAVLIAAKRAADTFGSWKRQKITERHMYQAESILTATYRAKYVLIELRNPIHSRMEQNKAARCLMELRPQSGDFQAMVTAQVYFNRLEDAMEARMGIYRAIPFGKTFWGDAMEEALVKLHQQFYLVATYASEHANHDYTMVDHESIARRKLIRDALYFNEAEQNDEIGTNTREAVAIIEDFCQAALRDPV